jgi:hypothetical protein
MDETHEVAPLISMLHWGKRTLAVQTPHRVQNRFQANAMLVDRPEFDDAAWKGRDDLAEEGRRRSLKSACAWGSAWTWRGRGIRRRAPNRRR